MKKYRLLCLLLVLSFTSYAQSVITIPKGFVETTPPSPSSEEWYYINNNAADFGVKNSKGKLLVKETEKPTECKLKLSDGILKSVDRGEWGGELTFIPADKSKGKVEIKKGNVAFLFKFKGNIYFIEGLAHMTTNRGELFELKRTGNSFTYKSIIDFGDEPEAISIYKEQLLVASYSNFYIVKDFKKEIIFKDVFWNSLYPNSIAVFDEENVFIGIRGGIVKLNLKTKRIQFYKHTK